MLFFWTAVFFRHNEWVMFAVMFVLDEKKKSTRSIWVPLLNSIRDASEEPAVHSETAIGWLSDLREAIFLL